MRSYHRIPVASLFLLPSVSSSLATTVNEEMSKVSTVLGHLSLDFQVTFSPNMLMVSSCNVKMPRKPRAAILYKRVPRLGENLMRSFQEHLIINHPIIPVAVNSSVTCSLRLLATKAVDAAQNPILLEQKLRYCNGIWSCAVT